MEPLKPQSIGIAVEVTNDSDEKSDSDDCIEATEPGVHKWIMPGTAEILRHFRRKSQDRKLNPIFKDAIDACCTEHGADLSNIKAKVEKVVTLLSQSECKKIIHFFEEDMIRLCERNGPAS